MAKTRFYVMRSNNLLAGRLGAKGSIVSEQQVREACEWYNDRFQGYYYYPDFYNDRIDFSFVKEDEGGGEVESTFENAAYRFDAFEFSKAEVLSETSSNKPTAIKVVIDGITLKAEIMQQNGSYAVMFYRRNKLLSLYDRQEWFRTLDEASEYMVREFEKIIIDSLGSFIY